jgi:hypothetical protein
MSNTVTAMAAGLATISACSEAICGQVAIIVIGETPGVVPTRIGNLGGGESRATSIGGEFIVGSANVFPHSTGYAEEHPFLWSASRGMEDLGLRTGEFFGEASFVNDVGTVIGFGDRLSDTGGNGIASNWIWTRDTGMKPLADPDIANAPWSLGGIDSRGNIAFASTAWGAIAFVSPSQGVRKSNAPSAPMYTAGLTEHDQLLIGSYTPPTPAQRQRGYDSTSVCGPSGYIMDAPSGAIVQTISPNRLSTGETLAVCVSGISDAGTITGSLVRGASTLTPSWYPFRWTKTRGIEALAQADGQLLHGDGVAVSSGGDVTVFLQEYLHSGSDSVSSFVSAVWTASGGLIRLGTLGGSTTLAIGMNDARLVAGFSQVGSNVGPFEAVVWDLKNDPTASSLKPTISLDAAKWLPESRDARGSPPAPSGLPRWVRRVRSDRRGPGR